MTGFRVFRAVMLVLFGAFFIVSMSLVVDILYAFIDPRVRY